MEKYVKVIAIALAIALASDIGMSSAIASAESSEDCMQKPVKVFAKVLNFSRKHRVTPFSHKLVKKVHKKVRKKPCVDDKPAIVKPILTPTGSLPVAPAPIDSPVAATTKPLSAESHIPGQTVIVPSQGFSIHTGYEPPRHQPYPFDSGFGWGFGFGGGAFFTAGPAQYQYIYLPASNPQAVPAEPSKPTDTATVPAPASALLLLANLVILYARQIKGLVCEFRFSK